MRDDREADSVDSTIRTFSETQEVGGNDRPVWRLGPVLPPGKELVTLRLDRDVLDWFRKAGKGYQTRINAVLRAYKDVHSRAG